MASVPKAIGRSALVLWLYATVTALVTVGLFLFTKERIDEQRRQAQIKALEQIVERGTYDNVLLEDTQALVDTSLLGVTEKSTAYIARQQQSAQAVILPLTLVDAYGGPMQMIVGVDSQGVITGVRVLNHTETPGLGDKIDTRKSDWIQAFVGKSLNNPMAAGWQVKKDGGEFDQFTGATITPRAVVRGVYRALRYFEQRRAVLMASRVPEKMAAKEQADGAE